MALGAMIVAGAYLLLAGLAAIAGSGMTNWMWLAFFLVVYTVGELFILPTGLGLLARLAPLHLGATTVGVWFLMTFSGNLSAGLVGSLWSHMSHPVFFVLLACLAGVAGAMLWLLNGQTEQIDHARLQPSKSIDKSPNRINMS
jgi:POT family proton-dependent oligopeptide transporter